MKKSVAFFFFRLKQLHTKLKKKKKKKKKKRLEIFEKLPGFFKILWKEKFQVYVF